jgi:serine O-acetyltransferase
MSDSALDSALDSAPDSAGRELRKLREDFRGVSLFRIIAQPGDWAVVNHRIAAALVRSRPLRLLYWLYAPLWRFITLVTGIEISPRATIGGGLRIVHWGQIFISAGSTIGARCMLLNGVTVGTAAFDDSTGPTLGDDVRIGTGARVLGQITLGDGCVVGANAVVRQSFPAGQTLVGAPARAVTRSAALPPD